MPIFGDPLTSRTFAPPRNVARPFPAPLAGGGGLGFDANLGGGLFGSGNNPFLFRPGGIRPVGSPGNTFGLGQIMNLLVPRQAAQTPNYGPLASNFNQLYNSQPQQTANPFQYF